MSAYVTMGVGMHMCVCMHIHKCTFVCMGEHGYLHACTRGSVCSFRVSCARLSDNFNMGNSI